MPQSLLPSPVSTVAIDASRTGPSAHPEILNAAPLAQGLYNPQNEHDACGVGFVAHIKGRKSHAIIQQGLKILENLDHRGAVGADELMGDGAGILIQIRSEEHTSELQSLMRISYAVFCLKKKNK